VNEPPETRNDEEYLEALLYLAEIHLNGKIANSNLFIARDFLQLAVVGGSKTAEVLLKTVFNP